MRFSFCLVLCVVWLASLAPATAEAGAWPRKAKEGFASASVRLSWPQSARASNIQPNKYYTAYLEYGLTDRVTLGFDLGKSISGGDKAVVFVQIPLRQAEKGPKIGIALGFGRIDGDPVIRPGLSFGWGREGGWMSADLVAEVPVKHGPSNLKLDMTWGKSLSRDRKLLLQLQTGVPAGEDAFVRFAPSIVLPLSDRLKLRAGISWGLQGDASKGVLLGLWTQF